MTKAYFGAGLPGVDAAELTGTLVVIEGSDGSGRSTQIDLLIEWLETAGHATTNVGLNRSFLVSEELTEAKRSNELGSTTRALFYATDFADQLENIIVPALRAGLVVLCDRYIYTLMAREVVRGADRAWAEALYGIALVPDVVFYLKTNPARLAERTLEKRDGLDYWESGMDLGLSRDKITSFFRYQRLLAQEFGRMQERFRFKTIDANRSIRAIFRDLQGHLARELKGAPHVRKTSAA